MQCVRTALVAPGNYTKNSSLPSTSLKCVSHAYGLNANDVKVLYIKMSYALLQIVLYIIGGLKRRRILQLKFLCWRDLIWIGED